MRKRSKILLMTVMVSCLIAGCEWFCPRSEFINYRRDTIYSTVTYPPQVVELQPKVIYTYDTIVNLKPMVLKIDTVFTKIHKGTVVYDTLKARIDLLKYLNNVNSTTFNLNYGDVPDKNYVDTIEIEKIQSPFQIFLDYWFVLPLLLIAGFIIGKWKK